MVFMGGTYYLRSFGCQMNDHDSERIAGVLEGFGMLRVSDAEAASVIVYNTCSIREKADTRLAGHLGTAARLKREDPRRLVVVAGCLAQSVQEELLEEHPFVDILLGPQSLHELPGLLERRRASGRSVSHFQDVTSLWSGDLPRVRVEGPAAWVQIVAGCSNYCSYCIVPHVRGPEASRPAARILSEVRDLAGCGVRQVTLLGQNVNAYGREPDFGGSETFTQLLEACCRIPGIERVRFMTSNPKDVSDKLVELLGARNAVCEHLHLPVQSGSDRTLTRMSRGYTRDTYLELVHRLRGAVPDLALTTDIIVGFPGETEDDFAETLSLVEECAFDGAFTFVYSPRRDTEAATLPDRIPRDIAEKRMSRLVELVQASARRQNGRWVGREVEVMVERVSRQNGGEVMGRTRGNKPVNFAAACCPGDMVTVELSDATSTSFRGRLAR